MRVELSEQAAEDIVDILDYTLTCFGRRQADEYNDGLFRSFDLLADNPYLGRRVNGLLTGQVRRYIYQSHYVFYEVRAEVIHIATIRNTRQDIPSDWPSDWRD
jgi:toxin ParE1/3/4